MTELSEAEKVRAASAVEIYRALDGLEYPVRPVAGDCLVWAPRVTATLVEAGILAETVNVAGVGLASTLASPSGVAEDEVIQFIHSVTLVGDLIIDYTARQFSPTLPDRWISHKDSYFRQLAKATGAFSVTRWPGEAA